MTGLDGSADADIEMMRKEFSKRRDEAVDLFNAIDGVSVIKPDGAFYLFVNISELEKDSLKFSKQLLEDTGVAIVPGVGFGTDGHFRFSFATDIESIREGISRIKDFMSKNY
ncbi:MAG TPA: aminotransferase class I/II-fold pyridoxal phosphate-dependent enzyme [Sulfurimonas sp.]|nr:aminotransferase class I/II-fold pyridoxal phosphate-dependent enzyme [Sulfurimonas sp.]